MFGVLNNKLRLSGADIVVPTSKLAVGTVGASCQVSIQQGDTSSLSGIAVIGPDGKRFGMNYTGLGLALTEAGTTRLLVQNGGNIGVGLPANSAAAAAFHIGADLRVDGNFTVNGSVTQINTNATITHSMNVTNNGTGPAVTIRQNGAMPVLDVFDDATLALRVADGGFVGINNANPAQWLDVTGNMQSSGFQRSAYNLTTSPAATNSSGLPNAVLPGGAVFSWNRTGTGAVCIANAKGSLTGGLEYVSYNPDLSFNQVSMSLDDSGNLTVAGSSSVSSNINIAGNAVVNGTLLTKSNLVRTGPGFSVGGPHETIYTSADAFPLFQKLAWAHDNVSLGFDAFFNGSQWLAGHTSTAFQMTKMASTFVLRPSAPGNMPGGTVTWSNAGLMMDATGRLGLGTVPVHTLDVAGDVNVQTNVILGGTVTANAALVATLTTNALSAGTLSGSCLVIAGNSSVAGNSSITGSVVVGSALSVSGTLTSGALVVTNVTSLTGNVAISQGSLSVPVINTGAGSITGLLTNNVNGALLGRYYDETVTYSNISLTPGAALPAPCLTRPAGQFPLTSINIQSWGTGSVTSTLSAKVTGYLKCPFTGTYTFRTTYADGATVWLGLDKLLDSWTYQGSNTQTISQAVVLRQNMWAPLTIQHAVAGGPERFTMEWSFNAGTYTTFMHANNGSNFSFAYDIYETDPSVLGSSYFAGRAYFGDTVALSSGASLPNALSFTGNLSELRNDTNFISSFNPSFNSVSVTNAATVSGTLVASVVGINQPAPGNGFALDVGGNINFSGSLYKAGAPYISSQWTSAGTNLYFGGGNVGIGQASPQTTLDVAGNINFTGTLLKGGLPYTSSSSQWTTSGMNLCYSGGNVGINQSNPQATLDVGGAVLATSLAVVGAASISGILTNRVNGALLLRAFDDSGAYAAASLTSGSELLPACMSRPVQDTQLTSFNLSNQTISTASSYSLRISGHILPPQTGTFVFRITTRDGASMYLYTQKVASTWSYKGFPFQVTGSVTLNQNMWVPIVVEHAAVSGSQEQLLIEWSVNAGTTWSTLAHGTTSSTFQFGYDSSETPKTMLGTAFGGRTVYNDTVVFNSRISNRINGSLTMRLYDDAALYQLSSLTAGAPLIAPFTTSPLTELLLGTASFSATSLATLTGGYSARMTGHIRPPSTGTYVFRASYRDGLSLYIAQQKLVDSWTCSGSTLQAMSTLTMYQNVWYSFAAEQGATSTSGAFLLEWMFPGGTFASVSNSNFQFVCDAKEAPISCLGTTYAYGRVNFQDMAYLQAGAYLPNANSGVFTGKLSELTNDANFLKLGNSTVSSLAVSGTVTAGALVFSGTAAGTLLQLINNVTTVSGTVTTSAYAAVGVTPGTALESYALTSHRWWTNSTGTTGGTVSMQLTAGTLTVSQAIVAPKLRRDSIRVRGTSTQNSNNGDNIYYISGGNFTVVPTNVNNTMAYLGTGNDCIQNTDNVAHYWMCTLNLMSVTTGTYFWFDVSTLPSNQNNLVARFGQNQCNVSFSWSITSLVLIPANSFLHIGFTQGSGPNTNGTADLFVVDMGSV